MKLRIPRRIKVEEDSSESESENVPAESTMQEPEEKDKTSAASSKATLFVNDGFNSGMSGISGVPTRTTSTLTPTTLRNIEQTFQDLQNDLSQSGNPYSAGFVPPPAPINQNQNQNQLTVLTNNTLPPYQPPMRQQQQPIHQQQTAMLPSFLNEMEPNSMESMDSSSSMSDSGSWHTPPPTVMDDLNGSKRARSSYASPGSSSSNSNPKPTRRNAGGRKPNKSSNLSPEEEEKRRVRRERNKQAAARCRRRREDHTSELQGQVDDMEEKKRQLTSEIQQMNQLRDELYELIEKHKVMNHCVIGDRQSPPDVKPSVTAAQNGKLMVTVPSTVATAAVPLQRPTNFISNNNNNNTMNANKLALKIKAEPLDEFYDEDVTPRKRKCDMLSGQEFDITTPTTPYMPQLNTPTFMKNQKPSRPSSLNVPANLKPSDFLARKNVADIAGISVNTPSTGMFNFDSLMEGGTGLTPVNPLIPCSTQNRNPMDMLQTPTSEPSKLVSL